MRKLIRSLYSGLVALLFLTSQATWGATIYANRALAGDCTGDYNLTGCGTPACDGSAGDAYNTIQEALDAAACGDTVSIATDATAYSENLVTTAMSTTCTDGNEITVNHHACDGDDVTLSPSSGIMWVFSSGVKYIKVDGGTGRNIKFVQQSANSIIRITNATFLTFDGLYLQGAGGDVGGISCPSSATACQNTTINNVLIEDMGGPGITFEEGPAADNLTVTNSIIRNNRKGITASFNTGSDDPPDNWLIEGNEVYGHDETGVEFHVSNSTLRHNIIRGNGLTCDQTDTENYDHGVGMSGIDGARDSKVVGNILANNGTSDIQLRQLGASITNNIFYMDQIADCTDSLANCQMDGNKAGIMLFDLSDPNGVSADFATIENNMFIGTFDNALTEDCDTSGHLSSKTFIRFESGHATTDHNIDYNHYWWYNSDADDGNMFRLGGVNYSYNGFVSAFTNCCANDVGFSDPLVISEDADFRTSRALGGASGQGDASDDDFHPRRQSPGIHQGNTNADRTTDIDGKAIRGPHDMGAYEQIDKIW